MASNSIPAVMTEHIEDLFRLVQDNPDTPSAIVRKDSKYRNSFGQFIVVNQLSSYIAARFADVDIDVATIWPVVHERWVRQNRNVRRVHNVLDDVTTLCNKHDVPFILLKGLYVADRFYGDVNRRNFWDLDILVQESDIERVGSLLERSGYARRSPVLLTAALSRHFTHAFDYRKDGCNLDLHWTLARHPAIRIDYGEVWDSAAHYTLGPHDLRVLADHYELTFLLLSIVKDVERGGLRIRSLLDLYHILRDLDSKVNWEQFMADRSRENIHGACIGLLTSFVNMLDCHEQFPELNRILGVQVSSNATETRTFSRIITHGYSSTWAAKRWAARIYGMSLSEYFLWWAVSLPFRLVVYKPGKMARVRRRIESKF